MTVSPEPSQDSRSRGVRGTGGAQARQLTFSYCLTATLKVSSSPHLTGANWLARLEARGKSEILRPPYGGLRMARPSSVMLSVSEGVYPPLAGIWSS